MKTLYLFLMTGACLACSSCASMRPEPVTITNPWRADGKPSVGSPYTGEITYYEPPTSSGTTTESPQPASNQSGVVDCRCKGIPLYGKVQVVTIGATFKVEVVTVGADLDVEPVTISPSRCGQWEFVTAGADFSVEFVTVGADFRITYVTIAPGTR